jgi:hypothetical protein
MYTVIFFHSFYYINTRVPYMTKVHHTPLTTHDLLKFIILLKFVVTTKNVSQVINHMKSTLKNKPKFCLRQKPLKICQFITKHLNCMD